MFLINLYFLCVVLLCYVLQNKHTKQQKVQIHYHDAPSGSYYAASILNIFVKEF